MKRIRSQKSKIKIKKDFDFKISIKYKIIFLFIISFSACENKSPISENTLVKVYADIVIAQDTTETSSQDFTKVNQTVFNKYNITAEDYKKSIMLLNKDAERWQKFFDKVIMHVENLKQNSAKKG